MKTLKQCPICETKKISKHLDCVDHTTSKEQFSIVSCGTCGFKFTNPRPEDNDLEKYYNSDKYISHTNSSRGIFNKTYQIIRKIAIKKKLQLLKKTNPKIGTHLDIGCGTGEFLNACKKAGYKTSGIEPSKIARIQAIQKYNLEVSARTELTQYSDSKFDTVSMWHVIEHIPKLNETVSEISRILRPNGKTIIAVPNHKSFDCKYYKEYWAAWDVPIHLWHFSKNNIEKLFKKHKLKLTKTKPMIFDSYYVSILSEEFKFGKKNLIRGLIIGFISNLVGICTKRGHSSTIYVFKKEE